MDKQIKIYLSDILDSILEIESYFIDKIRDFYEFEKDIRI